MVVEMVANRLSDLSAKTGAEQVIFSVDGNWFEVDLTADERATLVDLLAPYRRAGRVTSPTGVRPVRNLKVPNTTLAQREEIRQWLLDNGYPVAKRGRIPAHLLKVYEDAHGIKFGLR